MRTSVLALYAVFLNSNFQKTPGNSVTQISINKFVKGIENTIEIPVINPIENVRFQPILFKGFRPNEKQ